MTEPTGPLQPAIVVAVGGDPDEPFRLPDGVGDAVVVAVDSGLDRLVEAEVAPDHLVGDLDSAAPEAVAAAVGAGAEVHRHPADKDATDLELALDLVVDALAAPGDRLVVVGGGGGRLDLVLGDALLLAGHSLAHLDVAARFGAATVTVVRPGAPRTIAGVAHEQLSVLPAHGAAEGVTTTGVRWPLVDAHLAAGTTRGLSNELLDEVATVAVSAGTLLVVQPGTPAGLIEPRTTPYDPTPRPGGDPT